MKKKEARNNGRRVTQRINAPRVIRIARYTFQKINFDNGMRRRIVPFT